MSPDSDRKIPAGFPLPDPIAYEEFDVFQPRVFLLDAEEGVVVGAGIALVIPTSRCWASAGVAVLTDPGANTGGVVRTRGMRRGVGGGGAGDAVSISALA